MSLPAVLRWFQQLQSGRLRTPQAVYAAARAENPDPAQPSDRFFDLPPLSATWDAPERLRAPLHFSTNGYLRQLDRADWANTDKRLAVWAALFQEYARKRGIPLYVHCALRNRDEQERVRKAGHSKAAYGRSAHNIGEAVDIVHGVYHWDMTRQEWALLHTLGLLALDRVNADLPKARKLQLTWGGHFKSLYDPAHWEITDYRQRLRPLATVPPVRLTPRYILKRRAQWLASLEDG